MKKPISPVFQTLSTSRRRRASGMTLVEILVVIVIIIVLATLSTMGVRRLKFSAAKTLSTNQMRQIYVGAYVWATEKNYGEPFYAANGTATYGNESSPGTNPLIAPGNPAMILYNVESPGDGYLTDHTIFFSPLAKTKAPARTDYKPDAATAEKPWGSYAWFYPAKPYDQFTQRQKDAVSPDSWAGGNTSVAAKGKLVLANAYKEGILPVWDAHFLALMVDGSVTVVAQTQTGWDKWYQAP